MARRLGVSQPTYHRWESGWSDIPAEKLSMVAEFLGVPECDLLGIFGLRKPVTDESGPQELQQYGTIALCFSSGTSPAIFSISEYERLRILEQTDSNKEVLIFNSLGNDWVAVRSEALSEIYLSSREFGSFGSEHQKIVASLPPWHLLCDPADWEAIEMFFVASEIAEQPTIDRFREILEPIAPEDSSGRTLDEQWLNDGKFPERTATHKFLLAVSEASQALVVYMSNGSRRNFLMSERDTVNVREQVTNLDNARYLSVTSDTIGGYYRECLIRAQQIDYLRMPLHMVESGALERAGELLDGEPIEVF